MTAPRYARRAMGVPLASAGHDPEEMIGMGSGDAYPEGLPDLGDLALLAARTHRTETLQYAPRLGLPDLREWIAGYLATGGVSVTPDHVIVVNGAKHGLDLACKLFLDPGDTVVVTSPTYMSALGILRGYEATYLEVPQDAEGLDVAALEVALTDLRRAGRPLPKLVYDVTEFHNPTGITMSLGRRRALLDVAERYGLIVVEDDPYRRIRFEGEPVPPLAALGAPGRVISLGTFAKLVAPGLRVGWVVATPEIVGRMGTLKSDGGSCPLTQRLILEWCRAGRLDAHIENVTRTYRAHRDVMEDALRRHLPQARWRRPAGGYYLWVELPGPADADAVAAAAARRGVRVLPASQFYATKGPASHVRLAYSYAAPSQIAEGIRRLAEALREVS